MKLSTSNFSPAAATLPVPQSGGVANDAPAEAPGRGFENLFLGATKRAGNSNPAGAQKSAAAGSGAAPRLSDAGGVSTDGINDGPANATERTAKKPEKDISLLEAAAQFLVTFVPPANPPECSPDATPFPDEPGPEAISAVTDEEGQTPAGGEQADAIPAAFSRPQEQGPVVRFEPAPQTTPCPSADVIEEPPVKPGNGKSTKDEHAPRGPEVRAADANPALPALENRAPQAAENSPRNERSKKSGRSAEKLSADVSADFAERSPKLAPAEKNLFSRAQEKFLKPEGKEVMDDAKTLGINVAKSTAEMNSSLATQNLENVFSKHVLSVRVDGVDVSGASGAADPKPAEAAAPSTVHQAVEAVLEVNERFVTAARGVVKMEFNVSGEDLAVHVQMHEGRVQATFHTASPELRSALAQEWQSLTTSTPDASQRYAEPVFTSGWSWSSNGQGGENPGQHRGQEAHQPAERFEFSLPARAGSTSQAASVAAGSAAAPLTALRLHTFA